MTANRQPYTQFTEAEIDAMVAYIDYAERVGMDLESPPRDQDPDIRLDTVKKLLIERTAYREILSQLWTVHHASPKIGHEYELMMHRELDKIPEVLADPDPDWIYVYVHSQTEPVGRVSRKMEYAEDAVRRLCRAVASPAWSGSVFVEIRPRDRERAETG